MNCSDVKRWLDAGMPPESQARARGHAAGCPRCAASLHAQLQIEALLSGDTHGRPEAPPGFVDHVMAQVLDADRSAPRMELWPAVSPVPWWIQAASDPATALACVLVALLAWRIDWLADLVRLATGQGNLFLTQSLSPAWSAMGLDRPAVTLGLEFLLVPALAWGSFMLYRWTEGLMEGYWRRSVRHRAPTE